MTHLAFFQAFSEDQNHYEEKGTYTAINYGAAGGRVTT